jgi:hypothetical protein
VRAETEVGAVAQRQVRDALAGDVEALRIGEDTLVLVGLLHREHHRVPHADGDIVDLDVGRGVPGQAAAPGGTRPLDRTGETKNLLNGGADEGWLAL